MLDLDGDGKLDLPDVKRVLRRVFKVSIGANSSAIIPVIWLNLSCAQDVPDGEFTTLLSSINTDSQGLIGFEEFQRVVTTDPRYMQKFRETMFPT